MSGILIKNARIIDPSQGMDGKADLLVEDGKVKACGPKPHSRPLVVPIKRKEHARLKI